MPAPRNFQGLKLGKETWCVCAICKELWRDLKPLVWKDLQIPVTVYK